MRFPREPETPLQINIVPMIDVVFALLTFFIMSTLFLTRMEGLPVNLPKAATAKAQKQQARITLTIDARGNLALNKQPIRLEQIETALRALVPPNQQAVVVINADEKIDYGVVVTVMDRVRTVEGVKISLATRRP